MSQECRHIYTRNTPNNFPTYAQGIQRTKLITPRILQLGNITHLVNFLTYTPGCIKHQINFPTYAQGCIMQQINSHMGSGRPNTQNKFPHIGSVSKMPQIPCSKYALRLYTKLISQHSKI